MELLNKLYYNEKTGFVGARKLYQQAKEHMENITMKQVKDFLKNQETHEVFDAKNPIIPYANVKSSSPKSNYQIDLMEIKNYRQNSHYKYLLIIIDVYSRYVFIYPLKNKNQNTIYETLKENFEMYGYPLNINSDQGREFYNNKLMNFFEENHIIYYISDMEEVNKNSIVERFIRTLREIITKITDYNKSKRFIEYLPDIVEGYNNRIHSTTKEKPIDVFYHKTNSKQEFRDVQNPFKVGDKVRAKRKVKQFDKNTTKTKWSKKIWTVIDRTSTSVTLNNGKQYRPYQLHKVDYVM